MSILIKGRAVVLFMVDGRDLVRPAGHGMIHDPTGQHLPRCDVFVGPYSRGRRPVQMDSDGKQYFGRNYEATSASVDVPSGPWKPIGQARGILYERDRGMFANEKRYRHMFKQPVDVERCRSMIRMRLPDGCIVGWNGFVRP
jgi:hypothetical protein